MGPVGGGARPRVEPSSSKPHPSNGTQVSAIPTV
jgi:hypothetical protein